MRTRTGHVVVDGSNIATEGRSMPSLSQLNDAVLAFLDEFPDVTVTVVVDATFGHRIHKSEVKEFDSAIANNELVAPPAGAVGRGDAFVLGIADKAKASVLSNDSFQEFHGDYTWLFDEGRLVGGKPVPHVGWVFVDRVPVRGPVSRKATRETHGDDGRRSGGGRSKRTRGTARTGSKDASQPMPVPTSPPPGRGAPTVIDADADTDEQPVKRSRRTSKKAAAAAAAAPRSESSPAQEPDETSTGDRRSTPPTASETVNDLMPFLEFVEHHPVGTSVNAIVDSYSSHGAYVRIGDVLGYVPLRLMEDPAPRSAREVMKVGDAVTLVVASFAPARRSIDCAVPHMAVDLAPQDPLPVIEESATTGVEPGAAPSDEPAERSRPAQAAEKSGAKKTVAKKSAATKTAATKTAAKKTAATKAAATKTGATKAAGTKTAGKKAAGKQAAGKQAPTKKAPAKEMPAEEMPAKAERTTKPPVKKAAAKKAAAKKAAAKKSPAKKAAGNKAAGNKAATKKAPARRSAAAGPAPDHTAD
ncbi:hypothetical protein BH23ACT3_BH23ACT3_06170 [soil metagenome]